MSATNFPQIVKGNIQLKYDHHQHMFGNNVISNIWLQCIGLSINVAIHTFACCNIVQLVAIGPMMHGQRIFARCDVHLHSMHCGLNT